MRWRSERLDIAVVRWSDDIYSSIDTSLHGRSVYQESQSFGCSAGIADAVGMHSKDNEVFASCSYELIGTISTYFVNDLSHFSLVEDRAGVLTLCQSFEPLTNLGDVDTT